MDGSLSQTVAWVLERTGARAVTETTLLQNLWGGYGQLLRLTLEGGAFPTAILKRVVAPAGLERSLSASDGRKRRSYQVEQAWYAGAARRCDEGCRVARCLGWLAPDPAPDRPAEGVRLLLLEDLSLSGYEPARPPRPEHMSDALRWLAHFHSRFLGQSPPGLWPCGGYWHLATRRDEWRRMPDGPLKQAAPELDRILRNARYQTLMHGDAKPANFCWSQDRGAAAVDFQYVGVGCGIRDVAYFLDCCLDEAADHERVGRWLDVYFESLHRALQEDGHGAHSRPLEAEWRALFPAAWSDFQRFYQGWSSRAPRLGAYGQLQLRLALESGFSLDGDQFDDEGDSDSP